MPPEYEWTTLESEPFYLVAHKDTPKQSDAELLSSHPFIRLDPRARAGSMIDNELRGRGITPDEMVELDSLQAASMMVEQKLGLMIMVFGESRVTSSSRGCLCLETHRLPTNETRLSIYATVDH